MKDILRKLTAAWGPSGRESEVAHEIAALIGPFVDTVRTDPLGNVIATVGATAPVSSGQRRVMLCAHMDQACLVVTEATQEGLLRFGVVGRFEAGALLGQRVRNQTGTVGVVGLEDGAEAKDISSGKMLIDIGAPDRESAAKKAPPADVFVLAGDLLDFGDRVSAPALDNRAGCAVLVEVARCLRQGAAPANAVDFVFSVQGAVAPRGARPAAFGLEPDLGLVVDTTPAQGGGKPKTQVQLGKGPAIRVKEGNYVAPPQVRSMLERAADSAGVPHQLDVSSSDDDASDAAAIEVVRAGILTGVIGLPARFARTPAASVCLTDLQAAVKLLVRTLQGPLEM